MFRPFPLGLVLMVVLATILRVAILLGYESVLDSEEAVWALQSIRAMPGAAKSPYHPLHYVWQRHAHELGVAVPVYLGSVFFWLFGVSAMCFKSMGVVLSLPILPMAYFILARHIGRRVARIAALLIALSPAMYAKWNVKPYYFSLAIIANLAMAELALQIIFDRRNDLLRCGLLGLVAGLSLLNAPFGVPMIATIALVWIALGRHTLRPRAWLAAALGFVIGFSPMLLLDWHHEWRYSHMMLARSLRVLPAAPVWALPVKFSYLFGQTAIIEGAAPHTAASLVYCVLFVLGVCWLVVRYAGQLMRQAMRSHQTDAPRPPAAALFLVYILVYLVAWARSGQEMRYLIPIFPLALVPIAMMIAAIRPRAVRAGLLIAVSAAGAAGILGFAQSPKHGWDRLDYWRPEYRPLLDLLSDRKITAIYTSRFIGAHLVFDSRGAITAYHNYVAWPEYLTRVDQATTYAYVYESGSYYDTALVRALARRKVEYMKATVADVNVYHGLIPPVRLHQIRGLEVPTHGACWDEEAYLASLRLEPTWTERRLDLALGYHRQGRHQEAIRQARIGLQHDPAAVEAYVLLGIVYQSLGNTAARDDMWNQAVRIDSGAAARVRRLKEM